MTATKPPLKVITKPPAAGQVDRWHICTSGFRQETGEQTGLQRLWLRLGALRDPGTCVLLEPWDLDVDNLAELIWLCRPEGGSQDRPCLCPIVKIYGYSWGGWTAVLLARQLRRGGIHVRHLVLCDAVYRPRPWLLRWIALTSWPVIRIPDNVRRVSWFRQHENRPRGHDVVADDPTWTEIHSPQVAQVEHRYMDELRDFQSTAEVVARSF